LAVDGSFTIALNNLAMLLLNDRRQLDEADTLTKKAVEHDPGTGAFYDTRAQVLLAADKNADARAVIDIAQKLEPANLLFRLTSAEVSMAEGKLKDANAAIEAITREPNYKLALKKDEMARLDKLRGQLTTTSDPRN
jgi:predicted Zn-dependent protease